MRKRRYLPFNVFSAWQTKLNNYLPLSPGSSASKKIARKKLNKIFFRTVLNVWAKQAYIQGWYFDGRSYKDTCDMFERMNIEEQVYKGGATSKNTTMAESDRSSHVRKHKGGEAASPTNLN